MRHSTIAYRWHPLFGQTLQVSPHRRGKDLTCIYTAERPGLSRELPNWMFDQAYCAGMTLDAPQISLEGLTDLNRVQFETHSLALQLLGGGSYMRDFFRKALSRLVLHVDHERWGQTVADLRQLALSAPHVRSRERWLALYEIAQGGCATRVAERTGRHPQTVMDWLHDYNEHGPEALVYRHTGARPRFCPEIEAALGEKIRAAQQEAAKPPVAGADPPPRWTLKRLVAFVRERFARRCCRETIRAALRRLELSWKKAKKLLGRADSKRRKTFIEQIGPVLDGARDERHLLVYLDEAHIHQDVDLGYGWGERGKRLYVTSSSPGLSAKVSFYGLYLYNEGQVRIWSYPRANGEHTIDVLRRLRNEFPGHELIVIWDGAPYHRAETVWTAAASLDIHLLPLPGYSPDLMPVEALWRWLREDVTYHHCHATAADLIRRVAAFEGQVNQDPFAVADRLWVKDHLDPEEEKLRFSS